MKNIEDSSAFSDEMLARRIEYLSGFMLPERYRTLCKTVEQRTRYMTICTENMFHPQNASALVRNCEAFWGARAACDRGVVSFLSQCADCQGN